MRRLKFGVGVVVTALVASTFLTVGLSSAAYACLVDDDGDCYRSVTGTVTATAGLNLRAAPWGTILDTVPYNYSNTVDCYAQASDGSYWDWLYDTRIGRSGWVYDPYLYTGGNIYQQVDETHEGNCGQWALTMPSNVRATAIGTSRIRVTWTDTNGGGANYVISNGNVSSADQPGGSTSYTWGGLAPNTYMCFTVAAKANGGQSPWSPYACTTTWSLTTPSNISAVVTSTNSIRVSWTDTNGGGANYVVSNGNVSSADLPAGATSYTWSGIPNGTYMCFTVAAKQSGLQSAWSGYACNTTPIFVNLGDSFSSGEGTGSPYQSGTDVSGVDMCHRSDNSYSGQYTRLSGFWKTVKNVACSGAVTHDITNAPGSQNAMQIPTQNELAQVSGVNNNSGIVTVTIGGNNMNLGGIFTQCYSPSFTSVNDCFKQKFDQTFMNNIHTFLTQGSYIGNVYDPPLLDTYNSIKAAYPNATIIVSTYPQIFPATQPVSLTCDEIDGPDMLGLIRGVVTAINNEVKAAAAAANLTVLDEENAFHGHEVCTNEPWVNGRVNFGLADESFHPMTRGYLQWAQDLQAKIGG
jgi:hypothetical protein